MFKNHAVFKSFFASALLLGAVVVVFSPNPGFAASSQEAPSKPKNIILMIGDGFGFNQMEAGRCYQFGATGEPVYMAFDHYAMSTYAYDAPGYDSQKAWSDFDYLRSGPTDSAASGTAIACGIKTTRGRVGADPEGNTVLNVVEAAEKSGRSTGVATSVMFAHATPAAFVAHASRRADYQGIAQQMILKSAVDVIMGGGHPSYNTDGVRQATAEAFHTVGGLETWEAIRAGKAGGDANGDGCPDPWTLVESREDFQDLMSGPTPRRVIGIAPTATTLQLERSGDPLAAAFETPFSAGMPTLAEMTSGALNVLDDDPEGLFLMVEGGAIDWACHANVSGRMIEEIVDFNLAVQAAVDWIEAHGGWDESLLIVTSDHETGLLMGPGSNPDFKPIACKGMGEMPEMEWHSEEHTHSLVPFFVQGAGAQQFQDLADQVDPVRGSYLDNAELGRALLEMVSSEGSEVEN